jgi:hypothetical protein
MYPLIQFAVYFVILIRHWAATLPGILREQHLAVRWSFITTIFLYTKMVAGSGPATAHPILPSRWFSMKTPITLMFMSLIAMHALIGTGPTE